MANFSFTCTCGHTMTLDAPNRDAAVEMFQAGMTQEALDQHWRERHDASQPKPTLEQTRAGIGQAVVAA